MIREEEVVKIGDFTKAHGIAGELSISFINNIFEAADPDFIICKMDGILVPFFIEEYRFKTDTSAFIKLEDIDSEDKARKFIKIEVYLLKNSIELTEDLNHYSWTSFNGFYLLDRRVGNVGEILSVDETTMNVLFTVNYDGNEVLIPVTESLVDWIDLEKQQIQMNIPEGLLTL